MPKSKLRKLQKKVKTQLCASCAERMPVKDLLRCSGPDCPQYFCHGTTGCLKRSAEDEPFWCNVCCTVAGREFKDLLPVRNPDGRPVVVVICVWYLGLLHCEALMFQLAMEGVLLALDMPVQVHLQKIQDMYESTLFYEFLDKFRFPPSSSLLICVITEGTINNEGGLWVNKDIEDKDWHMPFAEFFEQCLVLQGPLMHAMMAQFKCRTIVLIACGVGLKESAMTEIWLRNDVFDMVILPTNMTMLALAVQGFLMQLVSMLYVSSMDIESAFL
ncbi:hypothetical protein FRC06_002485 [Ceratobasidium sp. 370]|nr:hypothetical protein FRC06_002485 [Ceratobasidium sp. 370]